MKNSSIIIISILMPIYFFSSVLGGSIKDAENSKRIPFVNVYIRDIMKGDMADSNGYFQIDDIEEGSYTLIARLIGYKELEWEFDILKGESKYIELFLEKEALEIEGVNVTTERSDFKHNISISKRTYSKKDLAKNPAVVQSDIMKSFQMLPSVTAASDFSSALYVRGGAPDQNLILYDRAPVFNPFHLGGMFSTFDVSVIESASFYAGGYNAQYGNRISSVIDIKTIIPEEKPFTANYDISLLSASMSVGCNPVKGLSFFVQGRRTYFDKMLELIDEYFPYYFYDITSKVNYRISDNTNASFMYFIDRDIIDLSLGDTLDLFDDAWGNRVYSFNLSHFFPWEGRLNASVYYSQYSNELNLLDMIRMYTGVEEKGGKIQYTQDIGDIELNNGFELYEDKFDYHIVVNDSDSLFNIQDSPYYGAAYVNALWSFNESMIIDGGLRCEKYEYFRPLYLSPRINMKFFVDNESAFSISYGYYRQFITSVKQETNDFSSVFGEMWMPVYEYYHPQTLRQVILGFEHWFTASLFVSVEAYNKNYDNLVHSSLIDLIINMDDPKHAFNETIGQSRGIEVLLKKTSGALSGWIGYAFSITEFLKDSTYVLTYYDKTHTLNANLFYELPWGLSASTSLVFSSGSPYTSVTGKYKSYSIDHLTGEIDGYSWSEIYSDYNAARFPPYFRWDLGLSKKFNIGPFHNKITLSIINITNYKNIFFYYYNHEVSPSERYEFNMLPFLPSVGVSGEF